MFHVSLEPSKRYCCSRPPMRFLSERKTTLCLRGISLLAATVVCLGLAGCGSSGSTPPPPPPPAPLGYAYVTTASNLFGFSITASNGTLTGIATPAGAPGGTAVASNAQKSLVYTLSSSGQISGYTLNRSDGSLTAISGSPWGGAGVGVAFLTVDSAGQNLYVPAAQDLTVVPFSIGSTGALTIGLQVSTPAAPLTATVDPAGHFLYVPMGTKGTELYQIMGGALADVETIPPLGQAGAVYLAINPAGTFAYVSDGVSGVAAYSINATTGGLTPVANTPFAAGQGPSALAITPSGKFLYVANSHRAGDIRHQLRWFAHRHWSAADFGQRTYDHGDRIDRRVPIRAHHQFAAGLHLPHRRNQWSADHGAGRQPTVDTQWDHDDAVGGLIRSTIHRLALSHPPLVPTDE